MKPNPYLESVEKILAHLRKEQGKSIEKAAKMIVKSISSGGALYCSEVGHGIHMDWISRAGGLFAIRPFSFGIGINDKTSNALMNRKGKKRADTDLENIRHAVKISNLRKGDVMLIGSVSGRNRAPVELALACRASGVRTIGFTSLEYTAKAKPAHPTGKRLYEVVDVVIDNGAPYGDASVKLKGYDIPVLPVSGVSCIVAGWMMLCRVLELMAEKKDPATVYLSVNREGGEDFNKKQQEIFDRKGY